MHPTKLAEAVEKRVCSAYEELLSARTAISEMDRAGVFDIFAARVNRAIETLKPIVESKELYKRAGAILAEYATPDEHPRLAQRFDQFVRFTLSVLHHLQKEELISRTELRALSEQHALGGPDIAPQLSVLREAGILIGKKARNAFALGRIGEKLTAPEEADSPQKTDKNMECALAAYSVLTDACCFKEPFPQRMPLVKATERALEALRPVIERKKSYHALAGLLSPVVTRDEHPRLYARFDQFVRFTLDALDGCRESPISREEMKKLAASNGLGGGEIAPELQVLTAAGVLTKGNAGKYQPGANAPRPAAAGPA